MYRHLDSAVRGGGTVRPLPNPAKSLCTAPYLAQF